MLVTIAILLLTAKAIKAEIVLGEEGKRSLKIFGTIHTAFSYDLKNEQSTPNFEIVILRF